MPDEINVLPAPCENPFIQHAYLQETRVAFQEMVACTDDRLINEVCDVFSNWASSCLQALEAEMEQEMRNGAELGIPYCIP